MAFRTKLDFSDNRQVKQHIETLTVLSGATNFGVPFNTLPTGPNLLTTGITETYFTVASTFSGNSASTVYSWYHPAMEYAISSLSALTPSNSGVTQEVVGFSGNSYTVIDGNTVALGYSGASFDLTPFVMYDLGGGNYSGTVYSETLDILSATTLDFTGRTIWADVSGITRTEDLIIARNPVIGNVWTCIDSEGKGAWTAVSGSGSTSSVWVPSTGFFTAVLSGSSSIASGQFSVAEGDATLASGDWSHTEGLNTKATGDTAHAEGDGCIASGNDSHAQGELTVAAGQSAHAEGTGTLASGGISHAQGYNTTASGNYSHSEGEGTTASGDWSHAQGILTIASGLISHAEGNTTVASGNNSHAEGTFSISSGQTSHAEGHSSIAGGSVSHAEGSATRAYGNASHAEGQGSIASGNISHAEGTGTTASGSYSHSQNSGTTASGTASHAEGIGTIASGQSSHAQGFLCIAAGESAHAEGHTTQALGDYSHTGGFGSSSNTLNVIASGFASFNHSRCNLISSNVIGDFSAILGGVDNNLTSGATRSVMLGGSGMTGTAANTVYVPSLNINNVGAGPGTIDIGVDANGTVVNQASDIRLKENIQTIDNALNKVLNLRGVTYNWKDRERGGNALKIGFIAQEVSSVVPELIFQNANDDFMGVHYKDVTALLVEAVKELVSGNTIINNTVLETQTIVAEDNNIELNYNGSEETAIGGGIRVLRGEENASELTINEDGDWVTNNGFKSKSITIPNYTPTSSNDEFGKIGNITQDDDYLYIKTNNGWKRTNLESF